MSMINTKDILETIKMIEEEHLDIRTITMGISLRDLAADDINVLADKVYDKVTRRAEKLVATGEQIERDHQQAYFGNADRHGRCDLLGKQLCTAGQGA